MGGGYVLDFSNESFQQFMKEVTGRDIYSAKYEQSSGSKAKRLRAFWALENDATVGGLLEKMVDYEVATSSDFSEQREALRQQCRSISSRLLGKPTPSKPSTKSDEDILREDFSNVKLDDLNLEGTLHEVMKSRLTEAQVCLEAGANLSVVILCGSILEGLLLGCALASPKDFNQAASAPKDSTTGAVLKFPTWSLSQFIDVATELRRLSPDVKKFGHALRDFRNYVHPYEQMQSSFIPDSHTAKICLQVLKAAIADLGGKRSK